MHIQALQNETKDGANNTTTTTTAANYTTTNYTTASYTTTTNSTVTTPATSQPSQGMDRSTTSSPPLLLEKRKRLTGQSDQAAAYQNPEVGPQTVRDWCIHCVIHDITLCYT